MKDTDKHEKVFGMRTSSIYKRATKLSESSDIEIPGKQQKTSILKRLFRRLRQIPIFYCFTKEYQHEIAYREFLQKHLDAFKLNT